MSKCIICQSYAISILKHREMAISQMGKYEELSESDSGREIEMLYFYVTGLADHINAVVKELKLDKPEGL